MSFPRGESGRMMEIQILVAFVITGILISFATHNPLKGFGIAFGWLIALFGVLLVLSLASDKINDLLHAGPVRTFLDSSKGLKLQVLALALVAAFVAGVIAAFASIFLAKGLSDTAEGQLMVMRGCTAVAALVAGATTFVAGTRPR